MGMYVVQTDGGNLGAPRDAARYGRAAAMARRRALAAGRSALAPAPERAASSGTPSAGQGASAGTASDGVAPARLGRALSMQRRRQLSQGKRALNGTSAGAPALIVHRGGAS